MCSLRLKYNTVVFIDIIFIEVVLHMVLSLDGLCHTSGHISIVFIVHGLLMVYRL